MSIFLKEQSLKWALEYVLRYGDTDVLPVPFEYQAIADQRDTILPFLQGQDLLSWRVRPTRFVLMPKSALGFRVIHQIDPLDFLLYLGLVYEIAEDIERHRVSVDSNRIFSYRLNKSSRGSRGLFTPMQYGAFLSAIREKIKERSVSHVIVTDIADFYPKIYHHRLEGQLEVSTAKNNHIKAIMKMLAGWTNSESYGIPVGNAPSRLLAEITIANIDEALLANGIDFVRYNDDYRIFCRSYTSAYSSLALLADQLFRVHGLTLQASKTRILDVEDFERDYMTDPQDQVLDSLRSKIDGLVGSSYEPFDPSSLSEDILEELESLNLQEMLEEQLQSDDELDIDLCRFLLRNLENLGDATSVDVVVDNIQKLYLILQYAIRYLADVGGIQEEKSTTLGRSLIERLTGDSILSSLDYYRLWVLHLFASSSEWNDTYQFEALLTKWADQFSRRELLLAMAKSGKHTHWFQGRWRDGIDHEPAWTKRALLAGYSCLPPDSRRHLYNSIEGGLDDLEKAVVNWVKKNPLFSYHS